jgi:uncharacterized phage protein (TIGR01671 family)
MREIKFRGWSEEDKEMRVYDYWFTVGHQCYLCFEDGPDPVYVDDSDVDYPDRIIPMQYTGLKDKNGKEIYEGDIVEFQDDSSPDDNGEYGMIRDVVVYNSLTAQFMINSKKAYIGLEYSKNFMEVIGNIYENPELLGESLEWTDDNLETIERTKEQLMPTSTPLFTNLKKEDKKLEAMRAGRRGRLGYLEENLLIKKDE